MERGARRKQCHRSVDLGVLGWVERSVGSHVGSRRRDPDTTQHVQTTACSLTGRCFKAFTFSTTSSAICSPPHWTRWAWSGTASGTTACAVRPTHRSTPPSTPASTRWRPSPSSPQTMLLVQLGYVLCTCMAAFWVSDTTVRLALWILSCVRATALSMESGWYETGGGFRLYNAIVNAFNRRQRTASTSSAETDLVFECNFTFSGFLLRKRDKYDIICVPLLKITGCCRWQRGSRGCVV